MLEDNGNRFLEKKKIDLNIKFNPRKFFLKKNYRQDQNTH